MRFVIDMNLTPQWVDHLESLGYDAIHWSNVGEPDASDEDIVAWAREHDFIVLTRDLDFAAIVAISGSTKPSVVQLRSGGTLPAHVGSAVTEAIQGSRADLIAGALLTVEAGRTRLRILPFDRKH
jgi:predicted nuclease of predicted toxin-antitoxin system